VSTMTDLQQQRAWRVVDAMSHLSSAEARIYEIKDMQEGGGSDWRASGERGG